MSERTLTMQASVLVSARPHAGVLFLRMVQERRIVGLGVAILLAVLAGLSGAIYRRSRATKVDHNNVNDEWSGGVAPAEPEPAAAA